MTVEPEKEPTEQAETEKVQTTEQAEAAEAPRNEPTGEPVGMEPEAAAEAEEPPQAAESPASPEAAPEPAPGKTAAEAEVEEAPKAEAVKEAKAVKRARKGEKAAKPVKAVRVAKVEEAEKVETVKKSEGPGTRWYVLRVQSNKEDTVRESLERRVKMAGLEELISRVLVPTEKVTEMKGGQKRVSERKLYPGYVMVEMALTEESEYLVRDTSGVGDFVGPHAQKPVPLTPSEVEKMLGDAEKTAEEAQPKVRIDFGPGDSVKIKEGPFQNFDGVVDEVMPAKGLVKVVVTIFGRPTPVELEYWQVEAV